MKHYVSLMQEAGWIKNSYNSLHYLKEGFGNELPKFPVANNSNNFVDTIKDLEADNFKVSIPATMEEIAVSEVARWTILFFDIEDNFLYLKCFDRTA